MLRKILRSIYTHLYLFKDDEKSAADFQSTKSKYGGILI